MSLYVYYVDAVPVIEGDCPACGPLVKLNGVECSLCGTALCTQAFLDSTVIRANQEFKVRKDGATQIAEERATHVKRGWDSAHDDTHTNGELATAAFVLLTGFGQPVGWIRDLYAEHQNDRIRAYVVAGSLIAAEIDRLQRLNA